MVKLEDRQEPLQEGQPNSQPRPCGSMHDNVETWEDCCVCEAEPRWQALAEEMEARDTQHPPRSPRLDDQEPGS